MRGEKLRGCRAGDRGGVDNARGGAIVEASQSALRRMCALVASFEEGHDFLGHMGPSSICGPRADGGLVRGVPEPLSRRLRYPGEWLGRPRLPSVIALARAFSQWLCFVPAGA